MRPGVLSSHHPVACMIRSCLRAKSVKKKFHMALKESAATFDLAISVLVFVLPPDLLARLHRMVFAVISCYSECSSSVVLVLVEDL